MERAQSAPTPQGSQIPSMQGLILHVSEGGGLISGDDNSRYSFVFADIATNPQQIFPGGRVDFQIEGDTAKQIIPIPESNNLKHHWAVSREKDKLIAGLLAIFLGGWGIHKFYLGYTKEGVIMLILGTVGWLLLLPAIINSIIALIEGIIYVTKSEKEFYDIYEANQKGWF